MPATLTRKWMAREIRNLAVRRTAELAPIDAAVVVTTVVLDYSEGSNDRTVSFTCTEEDLKTLQLEFSRAIEKVGQARDLAVAGVAKTIETTSGRESEE